MRGRFGIIQPRPVPARGPETAADSMRHFALVVVALGVLIAILYFGRIFFITVITAVIASFILEPFVSLLMRARFPRSLASFVVCVLAGLVLYTAGLGIYTQTSSLIAEFPQFNDRLLSISDSIRQRIEGVGTSTYKLISRQQPPPPIPKRKSSQKASATPAAPTIQEVRIHQDSNPIVDYLYARLGSVYQVLLMASFVPFLVYFMLSWGEHVNRTFLRFFDGSHRAIAAKSLQGIGDMARAFVVGNFLLAVMLAGVSWFIFRLISVPFPLLSGTLSGFLSIIPYVGLPLALIPPLLTAIGGSTSLGGMVLIMMIVASLHLTALNILYPKLIGSRVHLNPLVVTVALMFWSFLWDAGGLLLAIPITAGLKAVCDNVEALRPYGRFLGD